MPKISVIIPVYNTEKYLRECLDSVLNQIFQDFEIICINDGSTDNSLQILNEYAKKDERIKVISQKNKGAGAARNQGLKIAKGEYLAFLDGDDFFEKEFLDKMYHKSKNNDCDIVICSANRYNINTKITEYMPWALRVEKLPEKKVFSYKDMPNNIFNFAQNWNWNKIFKRDFIIKNNIKFQELYRTNDLYFTCCALVLASNITTIEEPLVNYRVGMTTNCQQTNHLHPLDFYEAFKKLRKFLIKLDIYEEVKESFTTWATSGCKHNIGSISNDKIKTKVIKKIKTCGKKDLDLVLDFSVQNNEKNLIKTIKDNANHKICFWGASLFLEDFLKKNNVKKDNVIGIIDKNPNRWGEKVCGLEIFPPEKLKELKVQKILFTIQNNNEIIYKSVQSYLKEIFPSIELLPNIFEQSKVKIIYENIEKQLKMANSQKIVFWGASLFLEDFIKNHHLDKYNIIGIIDKNPNRWGEKLGKYEILPPLKLKEIEPAYIIFTVKNNSEKVYLEMLKNIKSMNLNLICIFPNIFETAKTKDPTNKIYLVKRDGSKKEVDFIDGVDIIFEGKNNIVEIGCEPMIKFTGSKILCGNQTHLKIGNSNYVMINFVINMLAYNTKLSIGENFETQSGSILLPNEPDLEIKIGDNCMFSNNIYIRASDGHTIYDNKTKQIINKPEQLSIEIGNRVWLGNGVSVLKNSKISDNTIVGKSSIVNKKFEETNIILAGQPAKIVKSNVNWDKRHTHNFIKENS